MQALLGMSEGGFDDGNFCVDSFTLTIVDPHGTIWPSFGSRGLFGLERALISDFGSSLKRLVLMEWSYEALS